jgi:hypothetical protein
MSFPETVSAQTQTIPLVKKPDVEVLAWGGYACSGVARQVGRTDKFGKGCWWWLMVEKLTLNYMATALVDIPAVSMPILLCDKSAHFRVAF